MDKIEKALQRLTKKERERIKNILERISQGKLEGLHPRKLKGRNDIFRVRKGNLRVIYLQRGDEPIILAIERRAEKTYRHFS